jgi:hypothetical protein
MNLATLVRILVRRWLVVLVAAALALVAGYRVVAPIQPTFEATGSAVLVASGIGEGERRNPFLSTTPSLHATATAMASIVSGPEVRKSLAAAGHRASFQVRVDPDEPILQVTGSAGHADAAVEVVDGVLFEVERRLQETERAAGTPREQWVRVQAIEEPLVADKVERERARAFTALVALSVTLVLLLALVVEGLSPTVAATPDRPARALRTRGRGGASRAARGTTGVLVVYAVALVFVPERHQVSSFAVTAPMMIGVVTLWLWVYGKMLPGTLVARGHQTVVAWLIAFVAVALASYAAAHLRPLGDLEARGSNRWLAHLVMTVGVTLLAADALRRLSSLRRVLAALVVVATAGAVIGMAQSFFSVNVFGLTRLFPPRAGFTRVAGTANHPLDFAVFSAAAVPLALHFAAHAGSVGRRRLAVGSAAILGVATVLSITRSGILGLAVGIAVLLAGRPERSRRRALLGIVATAGVTWIAAPRLAASLWDVVFGNAATASIASRTVDYEPVLGYVARSPVLGRGFGTFDPGAFFVLDNTYLRLLVEVGVVGAAVFAGLIVAGIRSARSARSRCADPATRDLAQALAASLLVLGIAAGTYGLLGFQLGTGSLFLLLGCAGALARIVPAPAGGPGPVLQSEAAQPRAREDVRAVTRA